MSAPPLRRATAQDAPAIAALVDRAYRKYVPRIGQKPAPMLEDYPDVIARHDVWVLNDGAGIVAVLVLIPEPDVLLIDNVAVDPSHHGQGFGRQLMKFAEDEATKRGLGATRLYTNEKMTENIALYERYGYRETGREVLRGRNAVHMRKNF